MSVGALVQRLRLKAMKLMAARVVGKKLYERSSDKNRYPIILTLGVIAFQVVRSAVKLGIFDALDEKEGQTAAELSQRLALEQYPLQMCLRSLEYLDLLLAVEDRYYNHPLNTLSFLKKHREIFHTETELEYIHHVVGPACAFLEQSIRSNKPQGLYALYGKEVNFYDAISKDSERMGYFDAFMRNVTNRNKELVTASPFFSSRRKILDVGGSTGDIAISIAQHHALPEVTVLDFPEVLKIASDNFRKQGLEKRLKTLAGDPLKSLPPGYDCIQFFHFLDIFSPENVRKLLRNAYAALPAKGAVSIFTPVTDERKAGPADLLGPYFLCLAEGQGKFHTAASIVDWLGEAGFANISVRNLPYNEVLVTAERVSGAS